MTTYRIHGLTIRYDDDQEQAIKRKLKHKLGTIFSDLKEWRIVKKSIDSRQREVNFVYSVDFVMRDGARPSIGEIPKEVPPLSFDHGPIPLRVPPTIIGAGPAGLLAGYTLAIHGFPPLIIDRGGNIDERVSALRKFSKNRTPDEECNALFGIGGAGTFSDGKLTTGIRNPYLPHVLELLVECGAPPDILIEAKPHIGTNLLRRVINRLSERIIELGGRIETGRRMDQLIIENGRIDGIQTSTGPEDAEVVVLATGHSARDTWESIEKSGLRIEPKPFQMGIRAEHPQAWLDEVRYGTAAGHPALGAADYKLTTRINNVPVFSFCMCPGGETMPTVNEAGYLAINGMSKHARGSRFSSSALVVTLQPESFGGKNLQSCLEFQRLVERTCFSNAGSDYCAPAQRLSDFAAGRKSNNLPESSFSFGVREARLDELLPPIVSLPLRKALLDFSRKLRGYLQDDALALAPESRASSPVRIVRDPVSMQAPNCEGLYPVGEGAGYAGGIMSAALDGLRAAQKIVEKHSPPTR